MIESKEEMLYGDPSKTFSGVNFVLLGFDLSTEEKVFDELIFFFPLFRILFN